MKIIVVCYGIEARKIVGARKFGACVCSILGNFIFLFDVEIGAAARQDRPHVAIGAV